jgi:CRP/FNR family cyclic AMP-dependent transcriptional regulator
MTPYPTPAGTAGPHRIGRLSEPRTGVRYAAAESRGTADPAALAALPLFAGIPPNDLHWLGDRLARRFLPVGGQLIGADQAGDRAYVVLSGTLRVHLANADGDEITLALLGPGEVVGELSLIDDDVRSATVVALEPTALLTIDRRTYTEATHRLPSLVDNLIRILAQRLRRANAQVLALATLDVPGRVARQLLLLADVYGRPASGGGVRIELRLTQQDLADLVGATRVRVNQALGRMRRDEAIAIDALRRFVVNDPIALEKYL